MRARVKPLIAVVCAVLVMLTACGGRIEKPVEGGLYSTSNENGSYSVLKVLKVDDKGVHVRVYSNQFPQRPTTIDETTLYMVGTNRRSNETLGVGHTALSHSSFAGWGAKLIKVVPVKNEELEGYKLWLDAKGGYF
jgi:hypothetical protein